MVADDGNTMRIQRRAEPQINEKPACRKLWFKWDHGHFSFDAHQLGLVVFWLSSVDLGNNAETGLRMCVPRCRKSAVYSQYFSDKPNHTYWKQTWLVVLKIEENQLTRSVSTLNMFTAISQVCTFHALELKWVPRLRGLDVSRRGKQVNNLLNAYSPRTVHRHPRGDLQRLSKSPYAVNIRLRLF